MWAEVCFVRMYERMCRCTWFIPARPATELTSARDSGRRVPITASTTLLLWKVTLSRIAITLQGR